MLSELNALKIQLKNMFCKCRAVNAKAIKTGIIKTTSHEFMH